MKKRSLLFALFSIVILLVVALYLFWPSSPHQQVHVTIHTAKNVAERYLLEENNWLSWWPAGTRKAAVQGAHQFQYRGYSFTASDKYPTGYKMAVSNNELSIDCIVTLIPLGRDSLLVGWDYDLPPTNNPFKRIEQNRKAAALNGHIQTILEHFASFVNNDLNIYGIHVQPSLVTDTLLVTTKALLPKEPDAATIYALIEKLQTYIKNEGAVATNAPMLHARSENGHAFEVMVALPVNKVLPNLGNISFKRMVPGSILITEVKGGPHSIREAFTGLEHYMLDHGLESPAIPFESLITNRLQQADTTQWVTRIYYPVL